MRTAIRSRLLALILLLAPVVATGCFEIGELEVQNGTASPLVLWRSQVPCDFNGQSSGRSRNIETTLVPGQRLTVTYFDTDLVEVEHCIAVAGVDSSGRRGPFTTFEVERRTRYVVSGQGNSLRLQAAGPYEEEHSYDFHFYHFHVSRTVLLILGLPLLAGTVVALVITFRFFWDFYVRKQG